MAKRRTANGSGTIKQRKDGRWEGQYTTGINPGTGELIRKSVYGKTKDECAKKLRAATAAVDNDTYRAPQKITLKEWLLIWLTEYCNDLKERTKNTYRSTIVSQIIPGLGATKLSALKPPMIQRFVNSLSNLSPKSVKNVYGILHKALAVAVEQDIISKNPASAIHSLPRCEPKAVQFLAGEDLVRFLDVIKGNPYETVFRLAVFTGMREGELIGLSWDDIDFDSGTIMVRQQIQLVNGEYKVLATKNDKCRMLTPAKPVMDMLFAQRKLQYQQQLLAGEIWNNPFNLVFTRGTGMNIARNTLYHNFKRLLEKSGLPRTTRFHDLRHSYAVFALEAGDNMKEIQAALGHYSAAFTMNTYAHVSAQARRESAKRQEQKMIEMLS